MNRRSWLVLATFPLLYPVMGCQAQSSLPEEYLGQWYFSGSSGGMDGNGTGEPAVGWIVITDDNEIEHYDESLEGHCIVLGWFGGDLEAGTYPIEPLAMSSLEAEVIGEEAEQQEETRS